MNKDKFKKLIGKNIRQIRETEKMTQDEVASFGIDVKQYQKIERGLVNPTSYTIYLLSKAFKCSVEKIIPE